MLVHYMKSLLLISYHILQKNSLTITAKAGKNQYYSLQNDDYQLFICNRQFIFVIL